MKIDEEKVKAEFMEALEAHSLEERRELQARLKADRVIASHYAYGECGCVYGTLNRGHAFSALADPTRGKHTGKGSTPSHLERWLLQRQSKRKSKRYYATWSIEYGSWVPRITTQAARKLLQWIEDYERYYHITKPFYAQQ